MKIEVLVKARSKKESVELQPDGSLIVRVNSLPVDGRANKRVIELLAKYYRVSKSNVQLINGPKNKNKLFEIIL